MFLSPRGRLRGLRMALPAAAVLLVAAPAHAVTFSSAMDDARDIAVTTGESIAVFGHRILSGDMLAIQGAVIGFCALIGFIGLWLLVFGGSRDDNVIIATDESEEELLVLHAVGHTPAQPAPSPTPLARPDSERPTRLLEAVAAARAQYEIAVAERQGRTLI